MNRQAAPRRGLDHLPSGDPVRDAHGAGSDGTRRLAACARGLLVVVTAALVVLLATAPPEARGQSSDVERLRPPRPAARDGGRTENEAPEPRDEPLPPEHGGANEGDDEPDEPSEATEATEGTDSPRGNAAPDREPRPPREDERPRTVVLPHAGMYRAPALLRLAGHLRGVPVRVAHKAINRVRVQVRPRLGRRPVTFGELQILLAAHSLYLHEWEHEEKGLLLVASDRPEWTPPSADHQEVLDIEPGYWQDAWPALRRAVDAVNARLPESSRRMIAVPHESRGKVILWSPNRAWLDEVVETATDEVRRGREAAETNDDTSAEADDEKVYSYRGRFLPVARLVAAVERRLSKGDRARLAFRPVQWGNHVFFRTESAELATRVLELLADADVPLRNGTSPRAGSR